MKIKSRQLDNSFRNDDILLGRSSLCFNHQGNKRFRQVIVAHADRYNAISYRKGKVELVLNLIDIIQGSGGRFLQYDTRVSDWCEVSVKVAREKVGHALRDALLEKRKKRSSCQGQETASCSPHLNRSYQCTMRSQSPQLKEISLRYEVTMLAPQKPGSVPTGRQLLPFRLHHHVHLREWNASNIPPSRLLKDNVQPPAPPQYVTRQVDPSFWVPAPGRAEPHFCTTQSRRQPDHPPFQCSQVDAEAFGFFQTSDTNHCVGSDFDDERVQNKKEDFDGILRKNRCREKRPQNYSIDCTLDTLQQALDVFDDERAMHFSPPSTNSDSLSQLEAADDLDTVLKLLSSDEY